jgi:hypothetical protein
MQEASIKLLYSFFLFFLINEKNFRDTTCLVRTSIAFIILAIGTIKKAKQNKILSNT